MTDHDKPFKLAIQLVAVFTGVFLTIFTSAMAFELLDWILDKEHAWLKIH